MKKRSPKKITYKNLEKYTFKYLEKYAATEFQLRNILKRKVKIKVRNRHKKQSTFMPPYLVTRRCVSITKIICQFYKKCVGSIPRCVRFSESVPVLCRELKWVGAM